MAISYVGSASGTNSATLPAHNPGDTIFAFVFNRTNTTIPSAPSGWVPRYSQAGTACAARLFVKRSDGTTATGTFTNATEVLFVIFRSSTGFVSFNGNFAAAGTTNTLTFQQVPTFNTDGTSWAGGFVGIKSASKNVASHAPSGMINRADMTDANAEIAFFDTNGTVTAWNSTNVTLTGTAANWINIDFELREVANGAWDAVLSTGSSGGTPAGQVALNNGNRTATNGVNNGTINGTEWHYDDFGGKFFFEYTFGAQSAANFAPNYGIAALVSGDFIVTEPTSGHADTSTNFPISGISLPTFASGDTSSNAVDIPNRLYWIQKNGTGNWNNSPTANPATGVGGISFSSETFSWADPAYLQAFLSTVGNVVTINSGMSAFVGAVPSGFTPWASYSAGVSVSPSGAVVTASPGLAIIEDDVSIVGASVSATAGAVTDQVSVPPGGAAVSALAGATAVEIDDSASLGGASVSALAGAVSPEVDVSVALTGAAVTASAGSAPGDIDVSAAGTGVSAIAGSLSVDISMAPAGAAVSALAGASASDLAADPVGAAVTATVGHLEPELSILSAGASVQAIASAVDVEGNPTIAGAAVQAVAGTAAISEVAELTGTSVEALAGDVAASAGSGATVLLAGASVTAVTGAVAESVGLPIGGAACAAVAGALETALDLIIASAAAAAIAGTAVIGLLVSPQGAQATALAGDISFRASSDQLLSGASVAALAGAANVQVVDLKLNPNYVATARPRRLVATAAPRRRSATATRRNRTITGVRNSMARTNDLSPPIDADVEIETVTFDYGPILASGVVLNSISSITCVAVEGADGEASQRMIGDPVFGDSPATGASNAAVYQRVGTCVGGVKYKLQCVAMTSDGQTLSLWNHLACETPL